MEFQPSGFSKGSYLNVGAMWLWTDVEHVAFQLGYRVEDFVSYESDEQFAQAADRLARVAAEQIVALRRQLPTPQAAAAVIADRITVANVRDAGFAYALAGDHRRARHYLELFAGYADARPWAHRQRDEVVELLGLRDAEALGSAVVARIASCRRKLRLPELAEFSCVTDAATTLPDP